MRDNAHICPIDSRAPDQELIGRAAETIRSGGMVVFPTQILYGLGVDALNKQAVDRIFRVKERSAEKPVSILISRIDDLDELVKTIPPAAEAIINGLWPGGITLVFSASGLVPENLTAGTEKIGIRLPLHPVSVRLLSELGRPVTATSANLSGHPGGARIDDLPEAIIKNADLVLDAGPLPGGAGSTIVDVTVDPPKILREGVVPAARIQQVLDRPTPRF